MSIVLKQNQQNSIILKPAREFNIQHGTPRPST